jgi:hypothetical protein
VRAEHFQPDIFNYFLLAKADLIMPFGFSNDNMHEGHKHQGISEEKYGTTRHSTENHLANPSLNDTGFFAFKFHLPLLGCAHRFSNIIRHRTKLSSPDMHTAQHTAYHNTPRIENPRKNKTGRRM